MKKKRVLTLILLSFIMVTSTMKADFWSKLRDALIGGDNYSNSSSEDKNIVDGKIYNPKDNREYRLVEKMKDERENSQSDYRKFENSSSKIFYYECTINPKDFLSIIGFRTFYGYADFPVYETRSKSSKIMIESRFIKSVPTVLKNHLKTPPTSGIKSKFPSMDCFSISLINIFSACSLVFIPKQEI